MSRLGDRYADHAVVKYVRSLPEELYLPQEVANQLDVNRRMLDFLTSKGLGPTHQASYGGITMHLYTPQRVAEIAAELAKSTAVKGPITMWTRAELTARKRDQYRAYNYRRRAKQYREDGEPEKAARMMEQHTKLVAELERARAKRWVKVHGAP